MKDEPETYGHLVLVIFVYQLTGCATAPKIAVPTNEDQIIINAGQQRAKELGLRALAVIGNAGTGEITIVGPSKITYDRNGQWIVSEQDLLVNACSGVITLEGVRINRGEYARRLNYNLSVIR